MAGSIPLKDINLHVGGRLSCLEFIPPEDLELPAINAQQQKTIKYHQADGSDIVAAIVPVHIVRGLTGTIEAVDVACVDAPSGGDKEFSVDVLIANAGSPSPASILSAVIEYSASQSDCEVEAGTISSAAVSVGDVILVQVAVSGSTGTQGQGLVVTITIREDADEV